MKRNNIYSSILLEIRVHTYVHVVVLQYIYVYVHARGSGLKSIILFRRKRSRFRKEGLLLYVSYGSQANIRARKRNLKFTKAKRRTCTCQL